MSDGRVVINAEINDQGVSQGFTKIQNQMKTLDSSLLTTTRTTAGLSNQFMKTSGHLGGFDKKVLSTAALASTSFKGMSEETVRMQQEMKDAFSSMKTGMQNHVQDQIKVQYGYMKMAQGAKDYKGSTDEFIGEVEKLGKTQKKINDEMMKSNDMLKMSHYQTVGSMLARSGQSEKIAANYDRMGNAIYSINNPLLAVTGNLEKMAKQGNASVLALKMLGPTANMKELNDMTILINRGLMRYQMVAMAAAVGSAVFYGALHKAASSVPGYSESLAKLGATMRQAFQPMVEVFAAIMMRVYAFFTAIGELIIRFNEANPVLAKVIQGFIMLIPILTLLLAPLAIGIGLFNGMAAAFSATWMLIGPLITGLGAMMGTVLLVAGAFAVAGVALWALWTKTTWFKDAVITAWESIKTATMVAWQAILAFIQPAVDAIVMFVMEKWGQIKAFFDENGAQILQAITNVWNVISTIIGAALMGVWAIMQAVWPMVKSLIITTWDAIKTVIDGALKVIMGIIKTFSALFTGDWKGVWDGIKQILSGALELLWGLFNLYFVSKLMGPLRSFGTATSSLFTTIWNGIKSLFTNSLSAIQTTVTTFFNAYKSFITGSMNAISSIITTVWNAIKSSISTVMAGVQSVISATWATIRSLVSTAVSGVQTTVSTGFNALKSAVSTAMTAVKTAIQTGWNAAMNFLKGIDLQSVGKDIIQGLINGLASMSGALVQKAKDIADSVKNTLTGLFDIHSPSRWMRDMIGENMVLGWIKGIEGMKRSIVNTTGKMGEWMQPDFKQISIAATPQNIGTMAFNPVGSSGSVTNSTVGDTYGDISVTIPVRDMEEFKQVRDFFGGLKRAVVTNG
jgi:phage-related protein